MKIDRLIGILSVLLQKDKVTAPYLAEKFEVSRRTINRDIEHLCKAGIPVVTTKGANGGISIMEGYKIDRTLLTSFDMQAILTGLRGLDSASGTRRYEHLMEKLSAGTSGSMEKSQNILINLASWDKSLLALKLERIQEAMEHSEVITFTYFSPKEESEREIEPYKLLFQWSNWYAWGWCRKRQDFRLFKLNRMTNLQNSGQYFERREVPLPDLSSESIFPSLYQMKAVFSPVCKWRLIDEYGFDSFTEQPDGKLLFSYGFTDKDSILNWIVTFGDEAELLEPAEFRKELLQFGVKLQEKYKDS